MGEVGAFTTDKNENYVTLGKKFSLQHHVVILQKEKK